jgi:hypothetical protein
MTATLRNIIRESIARQLNEAVKDMGLGVKVKFETDGGMYISQTDSSIGRQTVILEPSQVKEISVLVASKKQVKAYDIKFGTKVTSYKDGGMYISQSDPTVDRQSIILEPDQVKNMFKK